jgi:hypothetical protein
MVGLSDLQTALRLSPYDAANPTYYYYICLLNKDAVARLHDLDPRFTVHTYLTNAETKDNPTYRAQATRAAEGMRKAGMPEE